MRLLVVTATLAERDAVLRDLGAAQLARLPAYPETRVAHPGIGTVVVLPAGPGPEAAVAAGVAVNRLEPDVVLSAGLGAALRPDLAAGAVVLSDAVVAVDRQGGPAVGSYAVPAPLVRVVHDRAATAEVPLTVGAVLSVAAPTSSSEQLAALRANHPEAVAEAGEGWGVAVAARVHGKPALEVRAVAAPAATAPVGPSTDESGLEVDLALDALARVTAALFAREWRPAPAAR